MIDKCRILWDQLSALWVSVALNPHANHAERQQWRSLLDKWSRLSVCPLEDAEVRPLSSSSLKRRISALEDSSDDDDDENVNLNSNHRGNHLHQRRPPPPPPRSIFHRALEASHLRWDDSQLRYILDHDGPISQFALHNGTQFTSQGYPLWHGECCHYLILSSVAHC